MKAHYLVFFGKSNELKILKKYFKEYNLMDKYHLLPQ